MTLRDMKWKQEYSTISVSLFANLLKDTSNYEAKPGQNVGNYYFKKLIPDVFLIDAVIGGIPNKNIVITIRSAQIQNADRLFAY